MKKIFTTLFLFLFIPLAFAAVQCPTNEVDCEYPGECASYTDENQDGYCDLSQEEEITTQENEHIELSGKDLKTMTVEQVAQIYNINSHTYAHALRDYYGGKIEPWDSFQLLHDNFGVEPSIAKDIALSLRTGNPIQQEKIEQTSDHTTKPKYEFVLLSLLTIVAYFFTYSLYRSKKITLLNHRRFWNWILLISFLISGILGILLVIRINYGIAFNFPFNILYWHVEAGIVMAIISIFHTFWHINYYAGTFRKNK